MRRPLGMVALTVAVIMMGWMVLSGSPPGVETDWDGLLGGEELILTGRVYDVQERQSYGTVQLWIYLDSIEIQKYHATNVGADISYHMICLVASEDRPLIGSRIQVAGQFDTFSQARNPGQFDTAQYYETLGICGILENAQILKAESGCSPVREWLYRLKLHWKEKLYNNLPQKEASILCAMLLGDKTELDEEIKDLYQQNGIVHILSISGLHITLIGMSLYKLLRRLGCPVAVAAVAGAVVLIIYGLMTGLGISAVRAIGMYFLRMLGEVLGRTYDMLTALGIMALGMLAARPALLQNGGFLLSFGSICGIGLLLPVLTRKGKGEEAAGIAVRKSRWQKLWDNIADYVKDALYPGLSVTLFTLPMQLSIFFAVPVYSLLLNLLVLPFMGVVMTAGILCLLIPGGGKIGLVSTWILQGYEGLCNLFATLPGHTWNPGAPEIWQIVLYYILLAGYIVLYRGGKGKYLKGLLLAGAVLLMGIHLPEELSVTFLDVGQGDCICIKTGDETYLFDCGSSSDSNAGENILIPFLQHEGITRLDGIFVSHPDEDHINGIIQLLTSEDAESIVIERLILPDIAAERRQEEFEDLLNAVQGEDEEVIPVVYMGRGTTWQSGQVTFTCLSPAPGEAQLDSNAYSQCFLVEYCSLMLLLTGDVEGDGEQMLTDILQETLQTSRERNMSKRLTGKLVILKVAHHGSKYSTSKEFLQTICPTVAIISCGRNNSYGHPHEELLNRLKEEDCMIYKTPETGAINIRVYRDEVRIHTFVE